MAIESSKGSKTSKWKESEVLNTPRSTVGCLKYTIPQVRSICFNSDGTRMATLDIRPEVTPGDGYDTCLKFWERRASGAAAATSPLYSVHDEFDVPHRYHPLPIHASSQTMQIYWKGWVIIFASHRDTCLSTDVLYFDYMPCCGA